MVATLERLRELCVVHPELGCWERMSLGPRGYGTMKDACELTRIAHRWAWEQKFNEGIRFDPKIHLDHFLFPGRCIGRTCCNPEHVRPTSPRENILRGDGLASVELAQTHCKHGHPFDTVNTYILPSTGRRDCRACRRLIDKKRNNQTGRRSDNAARQRRYRERQRAQ